MPTPPSGAEAPSEFRSALLKQHGKLFWSAIFGGNLGAAISRLGHPGFGGLIVLTGVIALIAAVARPRDRLVLSDEGFVLTQNGTMTRIAWADVEAVGSAGVVKLWLKGERTFEIENSFRSSPRRIAEALTQRCRSMGVSVAYDGNESANAGRNKRYQGALSGE